MFEFHLQTTHVVAEALNTAGGQWTIHLIVDEESQGADWPKPHEHYAPVSHS